MVRRGGQGYRTQAQKEGRSAGQRKQRQLRKSKQRMRERNKRKLKASAKTARVAQDELGRISSERPVYGVYEHPDGSSWQLTALSIYDKREVVSSARRRATDTYVHGRYVTIDTNRDAVVNPCVGIPFAQTDTKSAALDEVNADTSQRRQAGEYLIFPEALDRGTYITVDRDDYREFQRHMVVAQFFCDDDTRRRDLR